MFVRGHSLPTMLQELEAIPFIPQNSLQAAKLSFDKINVDLNWVLGDKKQRNIPSCFFPTPTVFLCCFDLLEHY